MFSMLGQAWLNDIINCCTCDKIICDKMDKGQMLACVCTLVQSTLDSARIRRIR